MYHFIVNPNSRSGLGRHIWGQIEPILKQKNIDYTVHVTKYRGHATKEAARLTASNNPVTLVVLGGDGTINEVICGIQHLSCVTLGYIPTGSSNDFARGFGMSKDPLTALAHILNPTTITKMDVGILSYRGRKRRFCVSCGIGFDAAVCHEAVVSKLKVLLNKIKLGKLTYVGIAFHQLSISRWGSADLVLDQTTHLHFDRTLFIAVMNHRFEGGGFMFAPDAKVDDGLLDVCVISDMPILKILALLPTAFFGYHRFFKGVHNYTCKTLDIHTELPLAVHTDGEPVFLQHHIQSSCEPEQIQVIVN